MSNAEVKLVREIKGSKRETKTVTATFYAHLNPNPAYNGGWKVAPPDEDREPDTQGLSAFAAAVDALGLKPKPMAEAVAEVEAKLAAVIEAEKAAEAQALAEQQAAKEAEAKALADAAKDKAPATRKRRTPAEIEAEKAAKAAAAPKPDDSELNAMG